jgi:cephalosporin hydroxylase
VDAFHRYYHDLDAVGGTYLNTYWLGVKTLKLPLDLWVYQEIVHSLRPDVIIETGTAFGGSALFLASMCDLVDHGRVITIDVRSDPGCPPHHRITYVAGSSTDEKVVRQLRREVAGSATVMVTLDSDHSKQHVLAELRAYAPLVTPGSYLIVEDTHLNGNPVRPEFGPGPREAVEEFLAEHQEFEADRDCEKFLMTFNRGGYLRRVSPPAGRRPTR